MSTHVVGIKPPDDKWLKMKAVWDACRLAKVDPPDEVDEFFNGEPPDQVGVVVDIPAAQKKYNSDSDMRIEVDLALLSPDIKIIRFVNSW